MHERDLTEIALQLADGTPVDWEALKSAAPEALARLLERFRQIEALARLNGAASAERDQLESIRKTRPADAGTPLRWGHLEILEKVGRGSYGDVYKARDARLDRIVALKLLRSSAEGSQSDSEIIDEARLLARVRHPNVVTVYGAERIDGRVGVWMEFIEGTTLEERIQTKGALGSKEICNIGIALCEALAAVNAAGLLHRDIKAQNVLFDSRCRVVLADFGAGHDLRQRPTSAADDLAGTPAYLAPEMWRGAPASPQTEVYGLGTLLYRLATVSFPVEGRTTTAIKEALGRRSRTPCHDAHTSLPRSLVRTIDRAIDLNPARRYQSAEALESALHGVLSAAGLRKAALTAVAHWIVSFGSALFEATFMFAAIFLATYLRFDSSAWYLIVREHGIRNMLVVVGVTQASLYYADAYDFHLVSDRGELFLRILGAAGAASIILAFIYYLFPDLAIGRGVGYRTVVFYLLFVIGWRLLFDFCFRRPRVT